MGLDRDPHRLVFVAGLHRSGTTPLARAIEEHPDVSGLSGTNVAEDEGQHLQDVYPPARTYGGAGRFAGDPRSHLTETSPLATPENAERLWATWEPYWDLTSRYLVEKSPPNLVMGRFLQQLFPGSAYVAVLRHPVIVALSTRKWRRLASWHPRNYTSVEQMVEHWVRAHDIFVADLPSLKRAAVLRYEDLVAEPTEQLARVQEVIGLTSPIPSDSISTHSGQYEQEWREWASGSPWQRRVHRRVVERFGAALDRFGYDVEAPSERPRAVPGLG